jgi:hypothetical protein
MNPGSVKFGRRHCLQRLSSFTGGAALASLLSQDTTVRAAGTTALPPGTHFAPRAKRMVYLFQSGAPSQLDLFDYKPGLEALQGTDLPDSIRQGQRLTGMTSQQERFPIAASKFAFAQHGESGAWVSELLPHTAKIADDLCFIRTLHTEAINHDPAVTFLQTGAQLAGRPSLGAWLGYGLGSLNENLPAYVAMISGSGDQPLYDRLWGSGFLPSRYQGVKLRSTGDPVPFLSNPAGVDATARRQMLDGLAELNRLRLDETGDPEIATRVVQYEMAFRMQTSVPELVDISQEPESTFELYGEEARKPGTFAYECLLARRMIERGVRFVQIFHRGWDHHRHLPKLIVEHSKITDQASAALVIDLKQRGLLEDTLVVWGGEFGRTVYCQGALTRDDYGAIITPAASPPGGPAAESSGVSRTASPTTSATTSQRPGAHSRPARDAVAPAGDRPRAADVQVPGARLPPDRRARRAGAGDYGLSGGRRERLDVRR